MDKGCIRMRTLIYQPQPLMDDRLKPPYGGKTKPVSTRTFAVATRDIWLKTRSAIEAAKLGLPRLT